MESHVGYKWNGEGEIAWDEAPKVVRTSEADNKGRHSSSERRAKIWEVFDVGEGLIICFSEPQET